VIREDRELLAELARLNREMASFALRIMDGSASATEQQNYAQRLIAAGESRRRAVRGVLPYDPPADHLHDVASLGVVERVPGGDVVPARQAGAAARRGGVLRDEHGMPAVRRLTAVVAWLGRGQPAPDQLLGVSADGHPSSESCCGNSVWTRWSWW
jgi:hypothetical protein